MDYYKTKSIGNDQTKNHYCTIRTKPVMQRVPHPSIWQKIRICIRLLIVVSQRHPYSKYVFRGSFAIQEEQRRHEQFNMSIHPYSLLTYFWQILMCFVYVFVVVFEIIELTFRIGMDNNNRQFIFSIVQKLTVSLNIICVADICLNFQTGYLHKLKKKTFSFAGVHEYSELKVELELNKIMKRYIKSYFLIDCLAFVNIIFYFGKFDKKLHHYLILLKILRHIRFITVFRNVEMALSIYRQSSLLFNLFILSFSFYYIIFFLSCFIIYAPDIIFYFSGKEVKNTLENTLRDTYKHIGIDFGSMALYTHASLLTINDLLATSPKYHRFKARTYVDNIHFFLSVCFSVVIKILFFVAIIRKLHNRYKYQLKFTRFEYQSKKFGINQNIDMEYRIKMHKYFNNYMKGALFSERIILNLLTPHLRYDIFDDSSKGLVRNCHLFLGLPSEIISALAGRLKLQVYYKGLMIDQLCWRLFSGIFFKLSGQKSIAPGTMLIQFGSLATCMYFIASGRVAVYSRKNIEICHLNDGDYFGEIGLLRELSTQRVANVICLEYCEIYRLAMRDFQQVIKPGTAMYQRIIEMAKKRLRERKRMSGSSFMTSLLPNNLVSQ